jgi:hypothetical protein
MFTGTLPAVSNRADWIECFQLLDEEDPTEAIDISDATQITIELRAPQTRAIVLTGTLTGGEIDHIETGVFQWHFTADQMSQLDAGDYEVGCTIVQDSITIQLLIGIVPICDGIVS